MAQQDNSRKKHPSAPQMDFWIRCVIGACLIYLSHYIIDNFEWTIFVILAALLTLAGGALIVTSIYHFFRGDYDLLDPEDNDVEPDDLDDLDTLDDLDPEFLFDSENDEHELETTEAEDQ